MLYNNNQRKWLVLGLIIFLGAFIFFALRDFLTSIIGSIILYTLFRPWYLNLHERKNWNSSLAAIVIILFTFFLLLVPLFSLAWLLIEKIIEFKNHPETINSLIEKVDNYVGDNFKKPDLVPDTLNKLEGWLAGSFPSAVARIIHIILQVLVMYFIFYFMLVNHKFLESTFMKYVPFPEKNALQLASKFKNITYACVIGHGLVALSQGILFGIGFMIFGIPNALFWAVVIMLFAFIPMVGPPAVFIPTSLVMISSGNNFSGIGILLYGLILVSSIEYFIRFFVARKIGNIHPVITILGLIIGLPFFGILGLVIGPLIVSLFILLIEFYEDNYVGRLSIKGKRKIEVED